MENDSYSDEETRPKTSASRKRKSDPARKATSTTKKARTATTKKEAASSTPVLDANASSLVADVLKNAQLYKDGDGDLGTTLVMIATYARQLENTLAAGSASNQTTAKKSPEQVQAAADKLRNAAVSGIKKQMSVSCDFIFFCLCFLFCDLPEFMNTSCFLLPSNISGNQVVKPAQRASFTMVYALTMWSSGPLLSWTVRLHGR